MVVLHIATKWNTMGIKSFVIKLVAARAAVLKYMSILAVAIINIVSVFAMAIIKPKVVIN